MMNFVFVDIDGVLNTFEDYEKWGAADPQAFGPNPEDKSELLFNPQLVARLNRITETASAQIVVSSSWRLHYSGNPAFAELRGLLKRVGVTATVVGPTPINQPLRWEAIEKWIATHDGSWFPKGCGRYAILDDDVPHDDWRWRAHHVHCLALPGGLTEANEQQAIALLTEGP